MLNTAHVDASIEHARERLDGAITSHDAEDALGWANLINLLLHVRDSVPDVEDDE